MDEDYFGTPKAPTSQPAPGWAPIAGTAPTAPPRSVSIPESDLAGIGVAVAGLLICLGAWGPWLHATGFGGSFNYGGLHSELQGKWVLGVGVIALALGVLLYSLPSGHELRSAASIAVLIVAVIGLVIVVHQYVRLSEALSGINGPLGELLGVHIQSGWGLWLAGLGCGGAGLAGFFSLVL